MSALEDFVQMQSVHGWMRETACYTTCLLFSPAHVSALVSLVAVAPKRLPTAVAISAAIKKNAVSLARSKDLVLTQFLEPPSAAHEGPFFLSFSFLFFGGFLSFCRGR